MIHDKHFSNDAFSNILLNTDKNLNIYFESQTNTKMYKYYLVTTNLISYFRLQTNFKLLALKMQYDFCKH